MDSPADRLLRAAGCSRSWLTIESPAEELERERQRSHGDELGTEIRDHDDERLELEKQLQALLPPGVQSFVSVERVLEVFPWLLLGFAVWIAHKLVGIRRDFCGPWSTEAWAPRQSACCSSPLYCGGGKPEAWHRALARDQCVSRVGSDGVAGSDASGYTRALDCISYGEGTMALLKKGSRGPEVRRLQRQLTLLGEFDDRIDGDFGSITQAAVQGFQRRHGLAVDGIVGENTQALLRELLADGEIVLETLRHAERERRVAELDVEDTEATSPAVATSAGHAPDLAERVGPILACAREEWERHVEEPPGQGWERIDTYIRGEQGLDWSWKPAYRRDGDTAWCGAFAAFCYARAGLKHEVRKKLMPSTYRIMVRWAKNTPRVVPIREVQPGDIVIVGPARGKWYGAHITLCESVDSANDRIHTFEGNAHGAGPDGSRFEGVIRQRRPFPSDGLPSRKYRVMHVVRPLPDDFE